MIYRRTIRLRNKCGSTGWRVLDSSSCAWRVRYPACSTARHTAIRSRTLPTVHHRTHLRFWSSTGCCKCNSLSFRYLDWKRKGLCTFPRSISFNCRIFLKYARYVNQIRAVDVRFYIGVCQFLELMGLVGCDSTKQSDVWNFRNRKFSEF